jgi:5-methylcytosine-specific restriction endonuclease McrA
MPYDDPATLTKGEAVYLDILSCLYTGRPALAGPCSECERIFPATELLGTADWPVKSYLILCEECFPVVKARYYRACLACGALHWQRSKGTTHPLCPACNTPENRREIVRVEAERARCARVGLAATLTLREWLDTLAHFRGSCAYCGRHPHTTIDHFVPVMWGGGTTKQNCVPACTPCNSAKHWRHPDTLSDTDGRYSRVREYLALQ